MKYTTKVDLSKGKKRKKVNKSSLPKSRLEMLKERGREGLRGGRSRRSRGGSKGKFWTSSRKRKLRNVGLVFFGLFMISGLLGGLWFLSYIQALNDELPPLDDPFRAKAIASIVYDRKGSTELGRFVGDEARDPVDINVIPEHVKWSFLSAEDIDFYTHQGFDPSAILRCGIKIATSGGGSFCGGSTITQQVVKITTVGTDVKIERKLKEMLMAVKIEQAYTKDEILQLYLTVAPFGGNIYGVTTASRVYFNKDVKDLTLAESAILASIVQNPSYLSPTKGLPDPETAQLAVKTRQEWVLSQMRKNRDKINNQTRINYDDFEMDDVITEEMIDDAFDQELVYQPPIIADIKAGHFYDYVRTKLTTGNYKYGEEPFTETELFTGGYRIYTTLDWTIQKVAEKTVKDASKQYGAPNGASNAAMVLITPKNGEVIAMVGSKDYYGKSSGCNKQGRECRFDPQVNIIASRQSPGSSTKPFGFYEAYRQGLMHTGTFLPDIPITLPGGYTVKNWNGSYLGVGFKTFAGHMLSESRNLPAIIVVEAIGIEKFLDVMRAFGYTTYGNSAQFGHSVILGGADVVPIEHAQGYGVFANGGNLVQHEVIMKIEDRDGNIIYEHTPKKKKVADPKAVFLLNQSILNSHSISWDGRNVSAKSGTSENSKDAWMAIYSPDFVAIGWMGNNNNKSMNLGTAFGITIVQPWMRNFLRTIGETSYLSPRTKFRRPAGVTRGGGCANKDPNQCIGSFAGISSGWMISEFDYAVDNVREKIRVCKDQKLKLARPIDEYFNNAKDAIAITYSMPYAPQWQKYLDTYLRNRKNQFPNGGPTTYCTKDYSGSGITGVWIDSSNLSDGATISSTQVVSGKAFTMDATATPSTITVAFDSTTLSPTIPINADGSFSGEITIPAGYDAGTYTLSLTARDSNNSTFVKSYSVILDSATNSNMVVSVPSAVGGVVEVTDPPTAIAVQMDYTAYTGGIALNNGSVQICINPDNAGYTCAAMSKVPGPNAIYSYNWTPGYDGTDSTYKMYVKATKGTSGALQSGIITITGDETPVVPPAP